jgi:hypothetical protein
MNKLTNITIASAVTSLLSWGIPTLTLITVAEDPPAETYTPGPWQPVARVNSEANIQVNIINQTGVSLDYSLTTGEIEIRQVAAGQTATLTNLPKDAYILINPQASQFSIQFEIEVTEDNLVNIIVQPSADPSGESTVNIQSNGGIYQY